MNNSCSNKNNHILFNDRRMMVKDLPGDLVALRVTREMSKRQWQNRVVLLLLVTPKSGDKFPSK